MIDQIGDGWCGTIWPDNELPASIGITAAFAVDADKNIFGHRATGEDMTHVRPYKDFSPLTPDYWRFLGRDNTLYIFERNLDENQQEILANWRATADQRDPGSDQIGPEYMTTAFASDYNPKD